MKVKFLLPMLVLSVFLSTMHAQNSPQMGIVIQSTDQKPNKSTNVHLLNISGKEVTAFNLSVKQTLPDGKTRTPYAYIRDMLEGYMITAKAFSPNDTFEVSIPEEYLNHTTPVVNEVTYDGTTLVDDRTTQAENRDRSKDTMDQRTAGLRTLSPSNTFEVNIPGHLNHTMLVVDVVIYADGTAQVQNRDRFKDIMDQRTAELRPLERVDDAIERVLADPAAEHPTASVVMRLKDMLADYPMSDHAMCMDDCITPEQRTLLSQIHGLTPFLSRNQEAPLNEILKRNKSQIAKLRPHVQVTEIPSEKACDQQEPHC